MPVAVMSRAAPKRVTALFGGMRIVANYIVSWRPLLLHIIPPTGLSHPELTANIPAPRCYKIILLEHCMQFKMITLSGNGRTGSNVATHENPPFNFNRFISNSHWLNWIQSELEVFGKSILNAYNKEQFYQKNTRNCWFLFWDEYFPS